VQTGAIGVLGGTFDPVHTAHLRLAHEAIGAFGLDHVRLIVSASPPHRPEPGASAEHRLTMLRLAVADNPALVVDDRELQRPAPSFTIDTLESLRTEFGAARPMCLIMGADAFMLLQTWRRWLDLFELAHIIVAHRPGYEPAQWGDAMGAALRAQFAARLTDQPARLRNSPGGAIATLAVTQLDISASAIRAQVAAGRSPRYLLPESVLGYIARNDLYRGPDAR
jgi:nicotinate-nucleotide adenylyltransferase